MHAIISYNKTKTKNNDKCNKLGCRRCSTQACTVGDNHELNRWTSCLGYEQPVAGSPGDWDSHTWKQEIVFFYGELGEPFFGLYCTRDPDQQH